MLRFIANPTIYYTLVVLSLVGVFFQHYRYFNQIKSQPPDDKILGYIFETVKIMLPVVTGYLVILVSALSNIWRSRVIKFEKDDNRRIGEAMVLGICSLGVWSGAMAFCIGATRTKLGNYVWGAMLCAKIAHVLFFASLVVALVFFYVVFTKKKPDSS